MTSVRDLWDVPGSVTISNRLLDRPVSNSQLDFASVPLDSICRHRPHLNIDLISGRWLSICVLRLRDVRRRAVILDGGISASVRTQAPT
jgi:hypothetical protein